MNNTLNTANIEVTVEDKNQSDSVWLSLKELCRIFGRDSKYISRKIREIFSREELDQDRVSAVFTERVGKNMYLNQYFSKELVGVLERDLSFN